MVEREPEGDTAPSVMSGQSEPAMAERTHDRHQVSCRSPLGMRGVVRRRCRCARLAVSAKVRADDRETALDQPRGDPVPCGRSPGVSVEQDNWRAVATMTYEDRGFSHVDLALLEALEHAPSMPVFSAPDREQLHGGQGQMLRLVSLRPVHDGGRQLRRVSADAFGDEPAG
jgi:hypothetical protein